jgi:carbon starvation protein CstA
VNNVSISLLGRAGGILAILGVIICPITSGDTAFRSARLTLADWLKVDQRPILKRLLIALPMFAIGAALSQMNFEIIWRYFAWSNQTLAMIVLWVSAVYLVRRGKAHGLATVPATFMTAVSATYLLQAPEGFKLSTTIAYPAHRHRCRRARRIPRRGLQAQRRPAVEMPAPVGNPASAATPGASAAK